MTKHVLTKQDIVYPRQSRVLVVQQSSTWPAGNSKHNPTNIGVTRGQFGRLFFTVRAYFVVAVNVASILNHPVVSSYHDGPWSLHPAPPATPPVAVLPPPPPLAGGQAEAPLLRVGGGKHLGIFKSCQLRQQVKFQLRKLASLAWPDLKVLQEVKR